MNNHLDIYANIVDLFENWGADICWFYLPNCINLSDL